MAQHAGQDGFAESGRVIDRIESGHQQVGTHDHVDTSVDGGLEWGSVDRFPLLTGVGDDGKPVVRISGRVAVAGEVLGRRRDVPVLLVALDLLATPYLSRLRGSSTVGSTP